MSVTIATRVFGSEVLAALIRHYRAHPGSSQADAAEALDLPAQLISANVRVLLDFAVIRVDPPARGRVPGQYFVNEDRVIDLLKALSEYMLGDSK